jgi:hypothetical protein
MRNAEKFLPGMPEGRGDWEDRGGDGRIILK